MIFGPATALVGRLRYAQKFVVVGLVLMVPLGFVAQAYVGLQQSQISFSRQERTGVTLMLPLVELTAMVAEARHRVVDLDADHRLDLRGPVAQVDALNAEHGEAFEMTEQWESIKGLIADAEEAETTPASFGYYDLANESLLRLIVHVGDNANLTLDPQLDSYYLTDTLQFQLPVLLDTSGRMVDRALLARRDLSIDRTELAIDMGLDNGVLTSTRGAIAKGLGTAARNTGSAEVRRLADDGFAPLYGTTQVLINQVLGANRTRRIQDIDPDAATEIRETATTFAAEVAAELDRLLTDRIDGYSRGAQQIQMVSLASALLAVYLFIGFYLSVSAPVRRMVSTLRAVADGDLDARVDVGTHDELSYVGLALNETVERTRQATERLAHDATHDLLTGLPNRTGVVERIGSTLSRPGTGLLAVLFLDLDHFKLINDSLGHQAGDELLRTVAQRLSDAVRPDDLVSRPAGDEFVIVCEDLRERDQALLIAERLQAALATPIAAPDGLRRAVRIGASIGIAFASDSSVAPDDLLRDAAVAMYHGKQAGRGRVQVFDEALRVAVQRRLDTQEDLRQAITEGGLCLYYQPIVDVAEGEVISLEALVRWEHAERGLLSPAEFIPIAEESGLIVPLGAWVLREACRQVVEWRSPGRDLHISVNLSAQQLADPSLVPMVEEVLADTGIDPDAVWLEITESTIMADAEAAIARLRELRRLGIHLSIDDFGTGYSSLAYLRRFPVETLKIDRSFVQRLGTSAEDDAIVGLVISLARTLGLHVVAEGVETADQIADLRRLGCHVVQGFFLGRPQPEGNTWNTILAVPQRILAARV